MRSTESSPNCSRWQIVHHKKKPPFHPTCHQASRSSLRPPPWLRHPFKASREGSTAVGKKKKNHSSSSLCLLYSAVDGKLLRPSSVTIRLYRRPIKAVPAGVLPLVWCDITTDNTVPCDAEAPSFRSRTILRVTSLAQPSGIYSRCCSLGLLH